MATPTTTRYRGSDILKTPADGQRYEVIDGELFVTPPPAESHQYTSANLFGRLWHHVHANDLGLVYAAPIGVFLAESDRDGVQPDIVYVSKARSSIIQRHGLVGAPDLIVEILSPSTAATDRSVKIRRYAQMGVPHYWLADPANRAIETYDLGSGRYRPTGVFGPGATLRPPFLPGLEIQVDTLWR